MELAETVEAVFQIRNLTMTAAGSAVVVHPEYAVTAAHLWVSSQEDEMVNADDDTALELVYFNKELDIAIVKLEDYDGPVAQISLKEIDLLDKVFIVGWPLNVMRTVAEGSFVGMYRNSLFSTAPSISGKSGGGLFACHNGEPYVTGIISSVAVYDKAAGVDLIYPHVSSSIWTGAMLPDMLDQGKIELVKKIFNLEDEHEG